MTLLLHPTKLVPANLTGTWQSLLRSETFQVRLGITFHCLWSALYVPSRRGRDSNLFKVPGHFHTTGEGGEGEGEERGEGDRGERRGRQVGDRKTKRREKTERREDTERRGRQRGEGTERD